jgi:hypothetical protein
MVSVLRGRGEGDRGSEGAQEVEEEREAGEGRSGTFTVLVSSKSGDGSSRASARNRGSVEAFREWGKEGK